MPYINKQLQRDKFLQITGLISEETTEGELNFILTTLIGTYVIRKGLCYRNINDVMGALTGCLLEFYRRVASPYEDTKIEENGDVDVYHVLEALINVED